MANRIIKDSIRISKKVNSLSDFNFRVWTYLITYVDDFGRGSADPELLKGLVFTRRKGVTEQQISKALADLATIGMITLYKVDGESYFCFPNWAKHQRIRDCKPKFPAPEQPEDSQSAAPFDSSPQAAASCGEPPPESESQFQSKSQKGFCSEPSQASEPNAAIFPVISLLLNDKSLYPVTEDQVNHWEELFPAVNVMQELRNMAAWCEANPQKRKTKSGILRFITSWLSKEQNKGGNRPPEKKNSSYNINDVEELSHFDLPDEL